MRTVLVVEDSFIESYELEYRLRELGYAVEIAATLETAKQGFGEQDSELAAVICDNRLIGGEPIGSKFYAHVRVRRPSLPFIVYSGFPPEDLPKGDSLLTVIRKPFMDDVIKNLRRFHSTIDKKSMGKVPPITPDREAA